MGTPKRGTRAKPIDRPGDHRPADKRVNPQDLSELLHELQVHQDELNAQNHQLIETQRALEESRDRYVDLYDFAPLGYVTISPNGLISEINLTGATMLGRERGRIVGLPFGGFVVDSDRARFAEYLRECRRGDATTAIVDLRLRTTDPPSHVQLVTRPHGGEINGKPGFLTAIIDITERKRLEQQRRDAEEARDKLSREREVARARTDAKDHFLATLSHELRTPLTPIVATLSNERLISSAPEPLRSALQTVRRNVDLEVRLIDDLLDVTRISRDRLVLARERVDIHLVLDDVLDMLGHEIQQRGIQIAKSLEAPNSWVIGDTTRLRQLFWNLLGNAIKFTPPGGRVAIASLSGPSGSIQVNVSDDGAGMDQTVVDSINERDAKVQSMPIQSATGLGLGLAICRGVVNAHGGSLVAMSAGKGCGSTFSVQIPFAAHLEPWNRPHAPVESAGGKRVRPRRILLVEDHQDSADTLTQLLMFHDFDVSVARSVEEAIAVAEQGFDLLISDVRLPDGSGLDLMRRLKSTRPVRGIAISGFGTEQDQRRSREAGYETHLTKPVDFNRLLDAIERGGG